MNIEKMDFNKEANAWDSDMKRVKMANDIADALLEEIALNSDMDVLDFGCGTGLLTLRLQPFVRSITGVDSSRGMLDVLRTKIEKQKLTNVSTRYLLLEKGDILEGAFDLIASSMTLHHIREIKPLLDQFYKVLIPEGQLCIADLDPDEGRFHSNNEGIFHFGFNREALGKTFEEAGFDNVRNRWAAETTRPVSDKGDRTFTVFLMTGRKRGKYDLMTEAELASVLGGLKRDLEDLEEMVSYDYTFTSAHIGGHRINKDEERMRKLKEEILRIRELLAIKRIGEKRTKY